MEVGIKRAKNDLSRLVSAAQAGQRVFLMNRGKRIAEIVPVRKDKEKPPPLPGYGMFRDELHLPPGWNSPEARAADAKAILQMMEGTE